MSADDPYGSPGGALGWAFRQLAIWGGIGLVVYAGVANRGLFQSAAPTRPASVQPVASEPAHSTVVGNSLVYHADQRGQFWVDGAANGASVRFLVDTGASSVVLTLADAAGGGIGRSNLAFTARVSTANGIARAAPVRLREVRIGQLSINDVQAFVAENLQFSLLGMTFLKRIEGFEIRDGVLTINWN